MVRTHTMGSAHRTNAGHSWDVFSLARSREQSESTSGPMLRVCYRKNLHAHGSFNLYVRVTTAVRIFSADMIEKL